MTRRAWVIAGRCAVAALGIGATVAMIAEAGPGRVLDTMVAAGGWLPLAILLEVAFIAVDVAALRALYGPSAVPARAWARSALIAYVITTFVPGGRMAGELARAGSLGAHVGGPRALASAVLFHGAHLWGNVLISLACYAAVAAASSQTSPLALLVGWNIGFNALLGVALLVGPRVRLPGLVGRWMARLSRASEVGRSVRELPWVPARSIAWSLVARLVQVAQCGVVLAALVDARGDVQLALIAEAIQLVAQNLGDAVPGQAGVLETGYRVFAPSFGLVETAISALAIALLLRASRLVVAAASAALWATSRPRSRASADA